MRHNPYNKRNRRHQTRKEKEQKKRTMYDVQFMIDNGQVV